MRYSMYFNRKKKAAGHLFQGRFFSSPLDSEHLYEALRYVELNPLRAGIISRVDGYKWSSMKMRLTGKGKYALSSVHEYVEIDDWKAYLKEKSDEEILETLRERTKTNRPAGDSKFIKKIEKLSGKTFNFNKQGRPKKK
jgi:putative transposase